MLSSQVKFSADRQTDTCKTICPRSIDAGQKKKKRDNVDFSFYSVSKRHI